MPLFGFGKKEKPPFKTPQEVIALRSRIETLTRENFPNLAQFREIASEAERVYKSLNAVIAAKDYATEATKLRDDLAARLSRLVAKINKNRQEAAKNDKEDYIDDNLEYLQRKSVRDTAKSLFADFLEQCQALRKCFRAEPMEHNRTVESISLELIRTLTDLNSRFFKEHSADKEIDSMKHEVLQGITELKDFLDQNRQAINDLGLGTRAEAAVTKITTAAKEIEPVP